MSDRDGAACGAALLSAAELRRVAVKGNFALFDPFQGACGAALAEMWTDLFARVETCMEPSVARLDAVLSEDMIEGLLPGFAHAVLYELGEVRQKFLKEELSGEGAKRLESVADVSAGEWLDALPILFNCRLSDGDVVCALQF
jgi:hypothetical protein